MTPKRLAGKCRRHAKMHDVASNRQDETREVLRKAAECIDSQKWQLELLNDAVDQARRTVDFFRVRALRAESEARDLQAHLRGRAQP